MLLDPYAPNSTGEFGLISPFRVLADQQQHLTLASEDDPVEAWIDQHSSPYTAWHLDIQVGTILTLIEAGCDSQPTLTTNPGWSFAVTIPLSFRMIEVTDPVPSWPIVVTHYTYALPRLTLSRSDLLGGTLDLNYTWARWRTWSLGKEVDPSAGVQNDELTVSSDRINLNEITSQIDVTWKKTGPPAQPWYFAVGGGESYLWGPCANLGYYSIDSGVDLGCEWYGRNEVRQTRVGSGRTGVPFFQVEIARPGSWLSDLTNGRVAGVAPFLAADVRKGYVYSYAEEDFVPGVKLTTEPELTAMLGLWNPRKPWRAPGTAYWHLRYYHGPSYGELRSHPPVDQLTVGVTVN